jgi:SAM-dependent methyltransferase
MDLAHRFDAAELMDTEPLAADEMDRALGFLAMTNRWFGGTRVVLRRLEAWSRRWDPASTITLLDAGCGAADIPIAVARWARRRGFKVDIMAVDLVPEAVAVARQRVAAWPEISPRVGDVRTLPACSFDYVLASLFLHHMPPAATPAALVALARLARRGLIVSDLERSLPGYFAVSALAAVAGNRVVKHDGPLSVRRAFTVDELDALAREAALPWLAARRERWFRASLAGER